MLLRPQCERKLNSSIQGLVLPSKPLYLSLYPCLWDSVIGLSFKCAQNPCFEVKSWTQGSRKRQSTRIAKHKMISRKIKTAVQTQYDINCDYSFCTGKRQINMLTDRIILCCCWNGNTRILERFVKLHGLVKICHALLSINVRSPSSRLPVCTSSISFLTSLPLEMPVEEARGSSPLSCPSPQISTIFTWF